VPTVSVAKATSRPRISPSRAATGASENAASGSPLGRPRWEQTTTRAPASASACSVGATARMRPSSVMVLPSRGTLRSARTSTRRPETPSFRSSSSVFIRLGADQLDEADQAVGEAPLVVVPADDLDLVPVDHLGQLTVDDAGVRVGLDVLGDDRVLGVGQDALERAVGGGLQRGVDLFGTGLLGGLEGEVGGGAGRDRNAHGEAVELAVELGEHQADGLGGAGRGGDHVQGRGAGATQVLVRAVL